MWQSIPEISVRPGAGDGAEQHYCHHRYTRAYLRKQGTRTCAGERPSKAKEQAAIYLTLIELFRMKFYLFTVYGFNVELFYQPDGDHAHNYCRANDTIHVKAL